MLSCFVLFFQLFCLPFFFSLKEDRGEEIRRETVLPQLITGLCGPAPKPILSQRGGRQRGLAPRLTLAMKTLASNTALMCFSQPEFSRPSRKSDMEGERSSLTGTTTQLHQRRSARGVCRHRQPRSTVCLPTAVSTRVEPVYGRRCQTWARLAGCWSTWSC